MRKYRRAAIIAGLGLTLVALVAWLTLPQATPVVSSNPGVSSANFHLLRQGMSEQEVEAVLGQPGSFAYVMRHAHCKKWQGPECEITVVFGEIKGQGAIGGQLLINGRPAEELQAAPATILATLGRWCGFI